MLFNITLILQIAPFQEPDSKYLRLFGSLLTIMQFLTLALLNSHRQYVPVIVKWQFHYNCIFHEL